MSLLKGSSTRRTSSETTSRTFGTPTQDNRWVVTPSLWFGSASTSTSLTCPINVTTSQLHSRSSFWSSSCSFTGTSSPSDIRCLRGGVIKMTPSISTSSPESILTPNVWSPVTFMYLKSQRSERI